METLIIKFKLPQLMQLDTAEYTALLGYKKTGNKFTITFNGSKGYLSNIEIRSEGRQKERNNVIWIEKLRTKQGGLRSKMVAIYHDHEHGVRVSVTP